MHRLLPGALEVHSATHPVPGPSAGPGVSPLRGGSWQTRSQDTTGFSPLAPTRSVLPPLSSGPLFARWGWDAWFPRCVPVCAPSREMPLAGTLGGLSLGFPCEWFGGMSRSLLSLSGTRLEFLSRGFRVGEGRPVLLQKLRIGAFSWRRETHGVGDLS